MSPFLAMGSNQTLVLLKSILGRDRTDTVHTFLVIEGQGALIQSEMWEPHELSRAILLERRTPDQ
jgi:hypothetical protein